MALLVLVTVSLCSAVGTAIGARLLLVAHRTRQLPELLVGTAIFMYAGLALPALLSMGLPGISLGAVRALQLMQQTANCAAVTALVLFTWRVFRPEAAWARLASAVAIGLALLASWGSVSVAPQAPGASAMPPQVRPWVSLMIAVWGFAFIWTGLESLHFHAKMRRRVALRLGDPLVCNRFLLWAVWGIACCALDLLNLGYNVAGLDLSRHPAPLLTICAATSLSSAVWYLAFFAPESYERLIAARARR
ncbi:MAG TPA: hypothetical protein VMR31_05200 [Myxococcota bacterium]|nr:hypothetical protein [Myxococcota bacterium]